MAEFGDTPVSQRKRQAQRYARALEEAKPEDLAVLLETCCMHCNRPIAKDEVRVLPPNYIQQQDPYVVNGTIRRRHMCVECYAELRSSAKHRMLPEAVKRARLSSLGIAEKEIDR